MLRALMAASVALTLAVAPAQAAEEINFGVISTEVTLVLVIFGLADAVAGLVLVLRSRRAA